MESNDSPENLDRGETSNIHGLPSRDSYCSSTVFFKLCIIITLLGDLPMHTRFDDLKLVSRSRVSES